MDNGIKAIILLLGVPVGFAIFLKIKQKKRKEQVFKKHEKPKEAQELGEPLNTNHSRNHIHKLLGHKLTGMIKEKYI